MMTNLFSMFDPSISMLKMIIWSPILIPIFIIPQNIFMHEKNNFLKFLMNLFKELKSLLKDSKKMGSISNLILIFLLLFFYNFSALFPFIFSSTAHASVSFFLSLTIWLSFMLYGWMKNFKNMMIHLVPTGTPYPLMNFMVLIEMVSNMIRPITLSVRLSANMVAGHLLMSLLSSFCSSSYVSFSFSFMLLILTLLETAVSFIQAYVFMTLSSLYSNEVI